MDNELIEYLYDSASSFSKYPALSPDERPPILIMTKKELDKTVCPEDPQNCYQLAAIFDDTSYRIIIRNDFDLQKDEDNSFLLHEITHALQFKNGDLNYDTHEQLCETEARAYRAQNEYLKSRGKFQRYGEILKFQGCVIEYLVKAGLFI